MALKTAMTLQAEDDVDAACLKKIVHHALTGDLYFHERMREVLASAGFDVSTVQQHSFHHIYEIRMKRGSFDLDRDIVRAARQVRRLLKKAKLYIEPDAIGLTRNGERIKLVFVYPYGAPGTLRVEQPKLLATPQHAKGINSVVQRAGRRGNGRHCVRPTRLRACPADARA